MKTKHKDTKSEILKAGRTVFLRKGFKNASLRVIAQLAGVTTGAIYGYYPDKQALFDALVAEPSAILIDTFEHVQGELTEGPPEEQMRIMHEKSRQWLVWMFDHIYDHYDAFKLILCCSAGTGYEFYIDRLVEVETKATKRFIELLRRSGANPPPIDSQLIHILANSLFSGMFEIVRRDMKKEEARPYIFSLLQFNEAGWDRLLGV